VVSISAAKISTGTLPNGVLDADLQDLADGKLSGTRVDPAFGVQNVSTNMIFELRDRNSTPHFCTWVSDDSMFILSRIVNRATEGALLTAEHATKAGIWHGNFSVSGALTATSCCASSDARLKKNIRPIEDASTRLRRLRGVAYEWRSDEFPERWLPRTEAIGLIAQEVESVVPEVVTQAADGYKAIAYDNITALLVEGFKEQQEVIRRQQAQIDYLMDRLGAFGGTE
jgi:hypothetical protein